MCFCLDITEQLIPLIPPGECHCNMDVLDPQEKYYKIITKLTYLTSSKHFLYTFSIYSHSMLSHKVKLCTICVKILSSTISMGSGKYFMPSFSYAALDTYATASIIQSHALIFFHLPPFLGIM